MVSALLALPATLGALVATGVLVKRAYYDRLLYLIAWATTQVGLSLALISMTLGFLAGFNGLFFRVIELGAALLGPLWLALGMIELIARYVQVRFGAWLFTASYTLVAMVIILVDPVKGSFGSSLPDPRETYDTLPLLLIDGAHVVAVISLVACLAVTAILASRQDREAAELLIPIALVALAGVLIVSGTRGFLPGFLSALALAGAAGLVWYGGMRTLPVYDDEYDEGYDGYDEYEGYGDEPVTGYEEQGNGAPRGPEPRRESRAERRRGELRFPEPGPEEPVPRQRYPDQPAAATVLDDVRGMVPQAAPVPGAPPAPGAGPAPGMGPEAADPAAGYGQITVYTLLDGREEAFDRLAEELVQASRAAEPDTLIFACHEVINAPTQRIFYRLFRDRDAFAAHERQAHLRRFNAESRSHVLTTNVIDLKLGAAKLPQTRPGRGASAPERPLK